MKDVLIRDGQAVAGPPRRRALSHILADVAALDRRRQSAIWRWLTGPALGVPFPACRLLAAPGLNGGTIALLRAADWSQRYGACGPERRALIVALWAQDHPDRLAELALATGARLIATAQG